VDAAPRKGVTMGLLIHHGVRPTVHPTAFVADGAMVIGDVEVGPDSGIWFNAVLRGDINSIRVGARANIQDGAVLHVTNEYAVWIGDDVTVGHQAMLHGCRIERGALVGMSAVVLDNARVGPFALVAAGSVVRENFEVPEGTLVAGVPAKVVRTLTDQEKQQLLQSASNYIEYARSFTR
jgi:carbonic anhydrase/acetyltransferase-like protein (isoleucine patch superfamily)